MAQTLKNVLKQVHMVLQLRPQDDQLKKVKKASGVASGSNFHHS